MRWFACATKRSMEPANVLSLDAVYEQQTVRLSDGRAEQRWPQFTQRVAELGVGSMLSCRLYVSGDNLGALNLYNNSPAAFGDESEHVGLLLASHAAVAMAGAQRKELLPHGAVRKLPTFRRSHC